MQEKVVFYTTHCPKCRALEMRLKRERIEYEESTNVDEMVAKGIKAAPALCVTNLETSESQVLEFNKAVQWINNKARNRGK